MALWQALRPLRELLPPRRASSSCSGWTAGAAATWCSGRPEPRTGGRGPARGELDGARRRRDALVAAGGRERRAPWSAPDEPFPATVFEQVHPAMGDRVRAHAVAALGDGRGPPRVGPLRRHRGDHGRARASRRLGGERRVGPRAPWRRRRPGPAAARRHAGRVEDVLGELTPRRTWSSPIRRAPGWTRGSRAALEHGGAAAARLRLLRPRHLARDLAPAAGLPARRGPGLRPVSPDRARGDGGRAGPGLVKYLVTVGGREIEVEVDGEQVTVGGRHPDRRASDRCRHAAPPAAGRRARRRAGHESASAGHGQWTLGVGGERCEARWWTSAPGTSGASPARRDRRPRARRRSGRRCRAWWFGCRWRRARRSRRAPGWWCWRR